MDEMVHGGNGYMRMAEDISPSLETLKLALGRLERATTRAEMALRTSDKFKSGGMTSEARQQLETHLESAIDRIDAILKEVPNG